MPTELIFPGDGVDSGDVVDTLVEVHADEGVRGDHKVSPTEIPVTLFRFIYYFHA